jgi:lipoprotein-anchoring transpeptidase ErfK/SrfK
MKAQKQIRLGIATTLTFLAVQALAQGAAQHAIVTPEAKQQVPVAATNRVIVVSLEDRKLALVENGKVVKVYPVATGKPSTPSPVGTFTIERRVANPTYSHDGRVVLPGPNNPVGSRWMGLSIKGYGIHGTNVPSSIGKAASHGCIRMAKSDIEDLYSEVSVGDTVQLIGHRDEETAQLFGDGATPTPAVQPPAQTALAAAAPAPAVPAQQHSTANAAVMTMTRAGLAAAAGLAVAGSM